MLHAPSPNPSQVPFASLPHYRPLQLEFVTYSLPIHWLSSYFCVTFKSLFSILPPIIIYPLYSKNIVHSLIMLYYLKQFIKISISQKLDWCIMIHEHKLAWLPKWQQDSLKTPNLPKRKVPTTCIKFNLIGCLVSFVSLTTCNTNSSKHIAFPWSEYLLHLLCALCFL